MAYDNKTSKVPFEVQLRMLTLDNPYNKECGARRFFTCLEVRIPKNGEFIRDILRQASIIEPKLNKGKANDSTPRDAKTVAQDNLAGLIAENTCRRILECRYGVEVIDQSASTDSSIDQIDIKLSNGKTIEVRSSGIRNGLEFAIFSTNAKTKTSYIDVIGPYFNDYKPCETPKDYYLRPIYTFDLKDFNKYFAASDTITLFILGGATRRMMNDDGTYVVKKFYPDGFERFVPKNATKYRAVPMLNALDACQFLEVLERENHFSVKQPFPPQNTKYFKITP